MRESAFQRQVMLDLSRAGCRVFRNNVGQAHYLGKNGKSQVVRYGLCVGSSDIVGWVQVEQVADVPCQDCGARDARLGLFLAVEVKGTGGKLSKAQETFQDRVREAGGIALVARPQTDTVAALQARLEARGLRLVRPSV